MGMFSFIGDILGDITGANDAADAATKASNQQLGFQQQGLDYLKETQAPLLQRREGAAQPLYDFYTNPEMQQQFYQDAQQSPTFDYLTGLGEESLMRNAAATGGLRGGGTQAALANIQPQIAQQLVNQRLRGLAGFANTPINSGQIANQYGQMGATQAAGTQAAAQARQSGIGQGLGLITGGLGLAGNLGWSPFSGGSNAYSDGSLI